MVTGRVVEYVRCSVSHAVSKKISRQGHHCKIFTSV